MPTLVPWLHDVGCRALCVLSGLFPHGDKVAAQVLSITSAFVTDSRGKRQKGWYYNRVPVSSLFEGRVPL